MVATGVVPNYTNDDSIRNDEEAMVTGEDGLAALETASQIITSINNSAM
ncbi:MAG: hypothetical protein IH825_03415 [Candidatus Marinimicrobia bacterium]|nr:hypothetical protein [Candidatus Neomarinimicrobiota bacterium]